MKKNIFKIVSLILVFILSISSFSVAPIALGSPVNNATAFNNNNVLESRFQNMLNHNFVYNESFNSVEDIVNNSVISLINMRDPLLDSYIEESFVRDFVYNMYGVEIEDFSNINVDFPQIDGFVYIIPRGFSVINHQIESVSRNEDGSYTVVSNATVNPHDIDSYTIKSISLFVKNENSHFGYNIIFSDLVTNMYSI